ncbi:hypothetical protein [Micromonospora yangpuensis]|uniref:Uncharacterized protein n=1 Tax=Micromonospora yangpuensis TaxID=683228 RepID=A0A1C6USH4_9ACTN|nr:hypothetical protein [Micromonospora yangpuensis]SCL56936.1 hypothetical protein GA0070617_3388 [Micromonospora yangpuensis]
MFLVVRNGQRGGDVGGDAAGALWESPLVGVGGVLFETPAVSREGVHQNLFGVLLRYPTVSQVGQKRTDGDGKAARRSSCMSNSR